MSKQGRVFGYARVSSTEQNLDRQLRGVIQYGRTGMIDNQKKTKTRY